jgi:hypothetical protein
MVSPRVLYSSQADSSSRNISASKIQRVQSSQLNANRPQRGVPGSAEGTQEEDDIPALAAQALGGVAEKLSSALSVEYKVNELIGQATDPRRLALIFNGWQPVRFFS